MALVDDFSTQDTTKWTFSSGATVSAGRLNLANPNTVTYIGVTSVGTQDLTGAQASAQLVTVPTSTGSMETYIKVAQSGNAGNYFLFGLSGGDLVAYAYTGGSGTAVYDSGAAPTAGTFLRIRESAGTTYFDTSSDGKTFTQRGSVVNPWAVTSMTFQILIGHFNASENTVSTTAVWDNFNILTVTATETGSGADAAVLSTATQKSDGDTGTGDGSIALLERPVSDLLFGTDTLALFSQPSADVGSQATDAADVRASLSSADTGSSSDAARAIVASVHAADTGSGAESTALTQSKSSSDTAAGAEATTVAVTTSAGDTGSSANAEALSAATAASDTGAGTDSVPAASRGVQDAASASEATSSSFRLPCSDSVDISDSVTFDVAFRISDPIGSAEGVALAPSIVTSEAAGLAETAVPSSGFLRDLGVDSAGLGDGAATTAAALQRPLPSDSAGSADLGVSYVAGYGCSPVDTVQVVETLTFFVSSVVQDAAGLAETTSTAEAEAPATTDDAGLLDSAATAWDYARLPADAAGLSDHVAFALTFSVADVATPMESLVTGKGYTLTLADSIAPTDVLAYGYGRGLTDDAGLVDGASTGVRGVRGADTATALEAATTAKVHLDFHRIGLMVDVHEDDPVMRVGIHRGS